MLQLFAHLIGDYFLQSDWMALNKQRNDLTGWVSVTLHAILYTVPFLMITQNIVALFIIGITHLIIDHFRVAAIVGWLKQFLSPISSWHSWEDCKETGFHKDRPVFIRVWLMIIIDNSIHLMINSAVLHYLGN